MFRRLSAIALAAGLFAAQLGCHSRCDRPGFFTSHSRDLPCQLTGKNAGCFDAVTGQPVPCPPGAPATVIPGEPFPGGPFPGGPIRPDELHMPAPTERIPPPAIPLPAPPGDAILPPPTSPGIPVKNK
ncbi:MAG: hypothetical protein L0241_07980 [Planctomycetia bacterium]|nr:hypothetical protein [Planctomycetia bacterium]